VVSSDTRVFRALGMVLSVESCLLHPPNLPGGCQTELEFRFVGVSLPLRSKAGLGSIGEFNNGE
jgi:hypothetical protein